MSLFNGEKYSIWLIKAYMYMFYMNVVYRSIDHSSCILFKNKFVPRIENLIRLSHKLKKINVNPRENLII